MNKIIKYLLIAFAAIFLLIQFLGPSAPATSTENPEDLLAVPQIDPQVADILRTACYNCHSMETKYPFYSRIAPLSWWIYGHINHGREELNFSAWESMKKSSKVRKLKDITEVIEEGEMPMSSYVNMHPEARLSEAQKELLINWANTFAREVVKKK